MKKYLITILILLPFVLLLANISNAQNLKNAFDGEDSVLSKVAEEGAGFEKGLSIEERIGNLISLALSFLGVIFLILMIYGGYMWMTAAGNDENVAKAQKLIKAAVIGLVIVLSSYAISYFVVSSLESTTTGVEQLSGPGM